MTLIRQVYHRFMKSLQGPVTIPASYIGLAERNEWIRNNHILRGFEANEKGPQATEEIIRILGSDYDSLEGLISITIPTKDDRLGGPIIKDDIIYNTSAELVLVSRFHAEGKRAYQYGRALLRVLQVEKNRRNEEDYLGRSKGFCCSTMEYNVRRGARVDGGCGDCEKSAPERWEIGRSIID